MKVVENLMLAELRRCWIWRLLLKMKRTKPGKRKLCEARLS